MCEAMLSAFRPGLSEFEHSAGPFRVMGDAFGASSPDPEEFGVYRAEDGKRLFGARVRSPSTSLDGYVLAIDGSQLAVLTRDEVSIYLVGQRWLAESGPSPIWVEKNDRPADFALGNTGIPFEARIRWA